MPSPDLTPSPDRAAAGAVERIDLPGEKPAGATTAPLFAAAVASDGRPALQWVGHGRIVLPHGCAADNLADFINRIVEMERPTSRPVGGEAADLAEVERLRADLADVSAYAHKLQVALTGLALGGSENFVRHGDGFRADIPACVEKVDRRFRGLFDRLKAEIRARKTAEAHIATLTADHDRLAREVERLTGLVEVPAGLRALSERATHGEWCWEEGNAEITRHWAGKPRPIAAVVRPAWHEDFICGGREAGDNAALIVAAINRLRAQIAATALPAGAPQHQEVIPHSRQVEVETSQ